MSELRFRVDQALRELSTKNKRDYDRQYVIDRTDISRGALTGILTNESVRVDFSVLRRLLDFFRQEGMLITPSDLLEYIPDNEDSPNDSQNSLPIQSTAGTGTST